MTCLTTQEPITTNNITDNIRSDMEPVEAMQRRAPLAQASTLTQRFSSEYPNR